MRQYNYIFNVEDKTIGIARTKCSDDKNMVPNSDEFDQHFSKNNSKEAKTIFWGVIR